MELRLGTCGWSYPDWKGTFYPPGTKDELAFYATQFDAVLWVVEICESHLFNPDEFPTRIGGTLGPGSTERRAR